MHVAGPDGQPKGPMAERPLDGDGGSWAGNLVFGSWVMFNVRNMCTVGQSSLHHHRIKYFDSDCIHVPASGGTAMAALLCAVVQAASMLSSAPPAPPPRELLNNTRITYPDAWVLPTFVSDSPEEVGITNQHCACTIKRVRPQHVCTCGDRVSGGG
jgi:hypothetical protein